MAPLLKPATRSSGSVAGSPEKRKASEMFTIKKDNDYFGGLDGDYGEGDDDEMRAGEDDDNVADRSQRQGADGAQKQGEQVVTKRTLQNREYLYICLRISN